MLDKLLRAGEIKSRRVSDSTVKIKWNPAASSNHTEWVNIMNVKIDSSNVNVVRCPDMTTATVRAAEAAANTAGMSLPGILFKQGKRYCVSTALPVKRARSGLLEVKAAKERANVAEVTSALNRPVMVGHVKSIADYLSENVGGHYILPPMTLNVQHAVTIFVPEHSAQGGYGTCYVVIPPTAPLSVTDGGHRAAAMGKAADAMTLEQLADFDGDAIAAMITLEKDIHQVHQDFADASKTKPLPKSQLAAYDRRNPANGLVLKLIDSCELFRDKIDSTSKTLSKISIHLFLTNQVRQMSKELLIGDYALADEVFERKAVELLGNSDSPQFSQALSRFKAYVDRITDAIPVLKEIANLPPGVSRNKIKERRAEGWICLTATGLVILGRVGHELIRDGVPNWTDYADRISEVDWSRSGELWQGNIVRDGKLTTQRAPVRVAAENVRRAVGLKPNPSINATPTTTSPSGDADDVRNYTA